MRETFIATVDAKLYRTVAKAGKTAQLGDSLEEHGIDGVGPLIARLQIPFRSSWRLL